jgi:uncharacterized membrane protein
LRLLIDILQGAGLAGAAGIRPFLPTLVAGALAMANVGIDYDGTDYAYLEQPGWMVAVALGLIVTVLLQRRGVSDETLDKALLGLGIVLGANLSAATLADHGYSVWLGLAVGIVCAALANFATRSLVGRVRARLDADARSALPVYLEGTALVLAALAVVVAPISAVALGFFGFLLRGGKRREGEKYAGLRILR